MRILSGKCCEWWLRTAALGQFVMLYKTVVVQDLRKWSIVYQQKQMLIWGSYSTCHGEIWMYHSPSLPVWSILLDNSVKMNQIWMCNTNFLGELTILIPRLPCLLRMVKAVSSTVELVNSVTSDSVNSYKFAMCAFSSKCYPSELIPWSDGWQRPWSRMILMMLGLLVLSIPHCK